MFETFEHEIKLLILVTGRGWHLVASADIDLTQCNYGFFHFHRQNFHCLINMINTRMESVIFSSVSKL